MVAIKKEFIKRALSNEIEEKSSSNIDTAIAILLTFFLLGLYGTVYLIDGILPTPLTIADEQLHPDSFIAERARNDLKKLTDIGPRVVGSPQNEVEAVDFIMGEIRKIQEEAHSNQRIEVDLQNVSGSYPLHFNREFTISAYKNVQNIVVKLFSQYNSNQSLLVNAHFDSEPTSPGASDDGINCVIMLEILRKLSRSSQKLKHNVIFLFNGAEETLLQASHGFITQHKWAKEIGVFLNLEAAGSGGKELLFQAHSQWSWLLKYYQKAPHPHGATVGEEIFETGIIPSDTDYRIFKTFGKAIGMDFAFIKDPQRYHTKFDTFSSISSGEYQHAGDNYLSLVRNLANSPELSNPKGKEAQNTIFFDYLGLFFVYYSEVLAIILHMLISALSIFIAYKSFRDFGLGCSWDTLKFLASNFGAILLGWIVSIFIVFLIACVLDAVKCSMSWYNNTWLIFGLYVVPIVTCCCGANIFLNHFYKENIIVSTFPRSTKAQIQSHLLRFIWTILLLVGTFCRIRSSYLIFVPLLFQTVSAAVIQLFRLYRTERLWQIIYVLATIIPNVLLIQTMQIIIFMTSGTSGRFGAHVNPEFLIGFTTLLGTILITSYYVPIISMLQKSWVALGISLGIFLIFFGMIFTPLGSPYSDNPDSATPQRFSVYHSRRILRDDANNIFRNDSGFLVSHADRNSHGNLIKYTKESSDSISIHEDCARSLLCGLPATFTQLSTIPNYVSWIPSEPVVFDHPLSLRLNSKIQVAETVSRFSFTSTGPNEVHVYISPRPGVTLTGTNLVDSNSLTKTTTWNGRDLYSILYVWGAKNVPLDFTLDFKSPPNWEGPLFDISLVGMYSDEKIFVNNSEYSQFLSQFPSWTAVSPFVASHESWVY